MASDRDSTRALVGQFFTFGNDNYGLDPQYLQEDPHLLEFLDYCTRRPWKYKDGKLAERPLHQNLYERVHLLQRFGPDFDLPFCVTELSLEYALTLIKDFVKRDPGSRPLSPDEVRQIIATIDTSNPLGKRFKAALLCIWETWARPSEVLRRLYPDELSADFDRGIVITVSKSKTNPRNPKILTLEHDRDREMCSICALDVWLQDLGCDYRGPLFPTICKAKSPFMCSHTLWEEARRHAAIAGLNPENIGSYSLRKGPATTSAIKGHDTAYLIEKLGQQSSRCWQAYVSRDAMFDVMSRVMA